MSAANNETAADAPLRFGLIADAEGLSRLSPAVKSCAVRLIAQAGMRQSESLPGVEWYDDTRVMIAQSGIQALLLATSVRAAVQLGRTALEHGVHVWRPAPLGRNFAEATEVVRSAREHATVYRVASWWDHIAADVRWAIESLERQRPAFSDVRVSVRGPAVQSWRASVVNAGGGVLVGDAYDMLEALVALRQLPESVAAVIGEGRQKPGETPRETEGTAAAILRYHGGGMATVQATWDVPPFQRVSCHHAAEASLVLDENRVAVRSTNGETLRERRWSSDLRADELRRFMTAVRSTEQRTSPDAALERHLVVSALLEAIFLAARTGQPETPAKLFEVQGWRVPRLQ